MRIAHHSFWPTGQLTVRTSIALSWRWCLIELELDASDGLQTLERDREGESPRERAWLGGHGAGRREEEKGRSWDAKAGALCGYCSLCWWVSWYSGTSFSSGLPHLKSSTPDPLISASWEFHGVGTLPLLLSNSAFFTSQARPCLLFLFCILI